MSQNSGETLFKHAQRVTHGLEKGFCRNKFMRKAQKTADPLSGSLSCVGTVRPNPQRSSLMRNTKGCFVHG